VYLTRFKACLNQALQLVKQYVVNIMRNTASQSVDAMKTVSVERVEQRCKYVL